jgi:hypothetical protein
MLFKTSNTMGTRRSHKVITTARIKTRLLGLSLRERLKVLIGLLACGDASAAIGSSGFWEISMYENHQNNSDVIATWDRFVFRSRETVRRCHSEAEPKNLVLVTTLKKRDASLALSMTCVMSC